MKALKKIAKETKNIVKEGQKVQAALKGPPPKATVDINLKGPNIALKSSGPKIGVSATGPGINTHPLPPQGMKPLPNFLEMDMYKIPESTHPHPLIIDYHLNGDCKICKANIGGQVGYRCDGCDILLCFNCSNRVFYGNKHKNCHPQHPLALTSRKSGWKCDLCKRHFNKGASFYCKPCDFDACDTCYLDKGFPQGFVLPPIESYTSQAGYSSQQAGFSSDPGYSSQPSGGIPPQQPGFSSDTGYSSQPSGGIPPQQPGFSSQFSGGIPPQQGFPPQAGPGFPPQGDSDVIRKLNETIKNYEIKLQQSENDFIHLKQSNMDERARLQETIDSLNKELAAKDNQISAMQRDLNAANQRVQGFDVDMNKMRIDLDSLVKERDSLLIKSKADADHIVHLGEDNKNLNFQLTAKINELQSTGGRITELTNRIHDLEFQLKGRDDQIMQINGRHEEDKRKMQITIDSINGQLFAAQNQLKNIDHLYATIKRYEEFINKLKIDIVNFQSSCPPILPPVH